MINLLILLILVNCLLLIQVATEVKKLQKENKRLADYLFILKERED